MQPAGVEQAAQHQAQLLGIFRSLQLLYEVLVLEEAAGQAGQAAQQARQG